MFRTESSSFSEVSSATFVGVEIIFMEVEAEAETEAKAEAKAEAEAAWNLTYLFF